MALGWRLLETDTILLVRCFILRNHRHQVCYNCTYCCFKTRLQFASAVVAVRVDMLDHNHNKQRRRESERDRKEKRERERCPLKLGLLSSFSSATTNSQYITNYGSQRSALHFASFQRGTQRTEAYHTWAFLTHHPNTTAPTL